MDFMQLLNLCLEVLKDWRVIFITLLMLVFVCTANYVVRYKKRPPKLRKAKKSTPAPAAAGTDNSGAKEQNASDQNSGQKTDGAQAEKK